MSVQTRLLAKAPGSLRPSFGELAIALAELAGAARLDDAADAGPDDAAGGGEAEAGEPITAGIEGAGPLLTLFEVHALSEASATQRALTAVVAARRWWRCDKVGPVSTVARDWLVGCRGGGASPRLTADIDIGSPRASAALAIASAPSETGHMAQNFDLGEFIREQRRTAQISVRQLAKLAGVSNPYLSQIERGLRRPSAEIMQQIAKGLRISAEALYVQAGILDERVVGGVVIDAIIADPTITERQKQVMVEVYDSFRKENMRRDADEAAANRAQAASASASGSIELDDAARRDSSQASSVPGHEHPAPSHNTSGHPGSTKSVTAPSARVTPLRTTMSRSTSPRRSR